ncbi:MAG: hypothetical protein ACE366_23945 [Bradymonadia bacterium]
MRTRSLLTSGPRKLNPLALCALIPSLAIADPQPTPSPAVPSAEVPLAPVRAFTAPAEHPEAGEGEAIEVAQRRRRRRRRRAAPGGIDDSDLAREETLEELKEEEYEKEAWSVGTAIGLSFIPGGGAGLIYAEKPAASTVPYLLSAIGYGVGIAYFVGAFDESSSVVCNHDIDGRVAFEECSFGDPGSAVRNDRDPRGTPINGQQPPYFQTQGQYTEATIGEDFDGKQTGLIIIAGTYVVTTVLGAVWAASSVSDHNDAVRKKIDSTVQAPKPIVAYDGRRGFLGLSFDF